VSADAFEDRRIAYHKSRQLRYFGRHRIKGVIEHPIIAGDNLWLLAVEQYGIPLWLLRQYNPDVNVDTILSLGSILFVPFVETLPDESACAVARVDADPAGDDIRPSVVSGKGID
jgi:membrane-bound lytic murein transglycosylase D